MNPTEIFLAYAADFEKSFADDDWSRLGDHFTDATVYRVESSSFPCEITGPAAIGAGMKKSLDGFDRRFDQREIQVTEGPTVDGDTLRVGWTVTYTKGDLPPFPLRGVSSTRVADGRIVELVDSFDAAMEEEMVRWQADTGFAFDPSYT